MQGIKNRCIASNMPKFFVSFLFADFRTKLFIGLNFNTITIKPINNEDKIMHEDKQHN